MSQHESAQVVVIVSRWIEWSRGDDEKGGDDADSHSEPEPSHSDTEDSGSVATLSGIEDSESRDTSDSEAVGNAGKSNSYSWY